MAERWVSTARNRFLLASVDALARLAPARRAPVTTAARTAAEVRSILVVELWNIGDLVLTLPFLAQLRAIFPRAKITVLGRPYARDVLGGTRLVDDFIEADLAWSGGGYRWRELWRIRGELKRRSFEIVFKARMHVREHFLLGFSGANRTVAYTFGVGDSLITDPVERPDPDSHKVEDWMGLLAPFGGAVRVDAARLTVSAEERRRAADYLRERGIAPGDVIVGVHPGASVKGKRWPLERFAEVAAALAAKPGVRVLAFEDAEGYGRELGAIPGVVLASVGLREMMALVERCSLLVCNDSGPMHIAGALGVPVVAVFGSGIRRWFGPLGEGHQFVEPDAGSDLNAVSVAAVMEGIEKAMARV